MKKVLFTIVIALFATMATTAQHHERPGERRHFSPEEFKNRQRAYITEKAGLTPEEADAFFPLFFELQGKKFNIERSARKEVKVERGVQMTEEQCREFVYKKADAKIEIAKLEKEYIDKYLKVISACKLQRVMHAENSFQRDLMKRMTQPHNGRKPAHEVRTENGELKTCASE